jgi:hypothetical protein
MTTNLLRDPSIAHRLHDGAPDRLSIQIVPRRRPIARADDASQKEVLPSTFAPRIGVDPSRGIGKFGSTDFVCDIEPVGSPRTRQLPLQLELPHGAHLLLSRNVTHDAPITKSMYLAYRWQWALSDRNVRFHRGISVF